MNIKKIARLISGKQTEITLFLISIIVTSWTFFRFYTKNINFDQTGQQVLLRQWMDGFTDGSLTAPTNYIVKMLLLYLPSELLNLNPKQFLIFSTVLTNIITFVAIYFLLKKILEYFQVQANSIFNLSMIWIASISGSVFWIQFTNSRNLEIVLGLLMLYLGLLIYKKSSVRLLLLFIFISTLAFFADPMQLFVTAPILISYIFIDRILIHRSINRSSLIIIGSLVVSFIFSFLMTRITMYLLNIEYFSVSSIEQSISIFSNIDTVVIETTKNVIRLFSGTRELGIWRQALNIVFAMSFIIISLRALMKIKTNKNLIVFTYLFLLFPIITYILSGQSLYKIDTSRYLIVLAFSMVFLFSTNELQNLKTKKILVFMISLTIIFNATSLLFGTITNYRSELVGENVLRDRYNFLVDNNYDFGYAGMDTAIPATYLYGRSEKVLLPLACEEKYIRKSKLFYDAGVFKFFDNSKQELVPIILDGNSISNFPYTCTKDEIISQLGEPLKISDVNGNTVLLYNNESIKNTLSKDF